MSQKRKQLQITNKKKTVAPPTLKTATDRKTNPQKTEREREREPPAGLSCERFPFHVAVGVGVPSEPDGLTDPLFNLASVYPPKKATKPNKQETIGGKEETKKF